MLMPPAAMTGMNEQYHTYKCMLSLRNLARNMAFLIRAIADAKEKYGLREMESDAFTSFPDGK